MSKGRGRRRLCRRNCSSRRSSSSATPPGGPSTSRRSSSPEADAATPAGSAAHPEVPSASGRSWCDAVLWIELKTKGSNQRRTAEELCVQTTDNVRLRRREAKKNEGLKLHKPAQEMSTEMEEADLGDDGFVARSWRYKASSQQVT